MFKESITEFDDGLDFSGRMVMFLDKKGHDLFEGNEAEDEPDASKTEERRRIIRRIFQDRKKHRTAHLSDGRNSGLERSQSYFIGDGRKEKNIYEWRMEQGHSPYHETFQSKAGWEGGCRYETEGIFRSREAEGEAKAGGTVKDTNAAAAKRDDKVGSSKPRDDPDTEKAAQKSQVANLIKQGKLKKDDDGKVLSFWGGDVRFYEKKAAPDKEKGLLRTAISVLASDITIVMVVMIASMALLPVTLGMFVSIHMVSVSVENMLSGFPSRGQILAQGSLSEEEIDEIVAESGANGEQDTVIRFALSKVGFPYSQGPARANGTAFDCSSLAYYSWQAAGKDISYGANYPPTAAVEASKIYSNGTVVSSTTASSDMLQPGDLIFYGGHDNGRYLGIYHVAVYLGNGKVVEAMNERYGVVYGSVRTKNVILVLRP